MYDISSVPEAKKSRIHACLICQEKNKRVFSTKQRKNGLNPDMRTLPPDYNEWFKANGLDPVEWDKEEEEYDDQWMINQFAKYSVELGSQEKGKTT